MSVIHSGRIFGGGSGARWARATQTLLGATRVARRAWRLGALALFFLGGPAAPAQTAWPQISLTSARSGFSFPVHIAHAGDGSGRLFVVELAGRIKLVKNGATLSTPFLDISDRVGCSQGLLSVAFPPGYASKGHFYVNYTNKNTCDLVVSRFSLTANADVADASSEQILLSIPRPANYPSPAIFHSGGELAFGADGFLYFGVGDGDTGKEPGDENHLAQDLTSRRGKIHRIDVETGNPTTYTIPSSNPYPSGACPEIWAVGVRNPWRSSFDRATGDYYIGDVGQNAYEEINFQAAGTAGGLNFGWRMMEGNHCHDPANNCDPNGLFTAPILEYVNTRPFDCSVTGGRVYRGTTYPRMQGVYLYGDYSSGKIWGARKLNSVWTSQLLLDPATASLPIADEGLVSFGEDEAGNIYVTDRTIGTIYLIADSQVAQAIAFTGPGNQAFSAMPIALSATSSSGLTVSFAIVSGPATVSGANLTLTDAGTVTVRATQAGNASFAEATPVDRTFVVSANFASWQTAKFTGAELANAAVSGAMAVFGVDGLTNLAKYALGLEPKTNITSGLPDAAANGSEWWFTYTRPAGITDVTCAVEFSTDLASWGTAGLTHELVSTSGGIETWRGRIALSAAPKAFFRLNVTQP
jgi:glucose/arabinose dehydrogenase